MKWLLSIWAHWSKHTMMLHIFYIHEVAVICAEVYCNINHATYTMNIKFGDYHRVKHGWNKSELPCTRLLIMLTQQERDQEVILLHRYKRYHITPIIFTMSGSATLLCLWCDTFTAYNRYQALRYMLQLHTVVSCYKLSLFIKNQMEW